MYEIPLTKEELDEEVCNYCRCTGYGDSPESNQPSVFSGGCEGSWCKEAYDYYLDSHCECSELTMKCCSKVKLINEKEVEEWLRT